MSPPSAPLPRTLLSEVPCPGNVDGAVGNPTAGRRQPGRSLWEKWENFLERIRLQEDIRKWRLLLFFTPHFWKREASGHKLRQVSHKLRETGNILPTDALLDARMACARHWRACAEHTLSAQDGTPLGRRGPGSVSAEHGPVQWLSGGGVCRHSVTAVGGRGIGEWRPGNLLTVPTAENHPAPHFRPWSMVTFLQKAEREKGPFCCGHRISGGGRFVNLNARQRSSENMNAWEE